MVDLNLTASLVMPECLCRASMRLSSKPDVQASGFPLEARGNDERESLAGTTRGTVVRNTPLRVVLPACL